MAFTGITATEPEIDQKTGANVSTSFTDTMKTAALLAAESTVNVATRFNWSDSFGTDNVDVRSIITSATASLVAIEAISYDMSGYTSRSEAESMLNVLRDAALRAISILKDIKAQQFLQAA